MKPCLNPQCKGHGASHPNCGCYPEYANGGKVAAFCSKDRAHKDGCEYFAEGGMAGAIPIDQFETAQSGQNLSQSVPIPEGAIPVDQFESHSDHYGSITQKAITAVEGLGKGLAGPLSTLAETKLLGVDPKDITAREEENPIEHYGAEATGLIAPALLTGGASSFTQAGALAKVGSFAAKTLGLKGSLETVAKLGIENALYTVGDEISKSIVGNPDSIQTAAMHVGLSGLLGAGAGAALGKVSDVWLSKVGPKAEAFVKDFSEVLKAHSHDPAASVVEAGSSSNPFVQDILSKKAAKQASSKGSEVADAVLEKVNKAATEAISTGIGAAAGRLTGIPGAAYMGAIFGERAIKPFIETSMPSIIKGLVRQAPSGEAFKAALDGVHAIAKGESLANTVVKSLFEQGSTAGLKELIQDKDTLTKLDDHIKTLANDPQAMMQMGGKLGHYMPDHTTALASTAQNAVNYLNSQRPTETQAGPLDRKVPPSKGQENAYSRTLSIAEQPLGLFYFLNQGSLTPKDVQDFKTLYPALYPGMKQKINNQMIDHISKGKLVPFKMRKGLSMFMEQPMDSNFSQPSILAAQATYMPLKGPEQAQGAPKAKGGASKLGKSVELAQTPSQERQESLHKA